MIIEKFLVNGLHGLIDADITFQRDINIIVGRNGSGKTSVLSLLSSLIRLDIETIKSMTFQMAEMHVNMADSGKVIVIAVNSSDESSISINWEGRDSIKIPLIDTELFYRIGAKRLPDSYLAASIGVSNQASATEILQKWSQISTDFLRLAKLTFVRLDRTIIAMDPEGLETSEVTLPSGRDRQKVSAVKRDPIDEVMRVTQANYFHFRRRVDVIRANAYKELMRLHFAPIKPLGKKANIGQLKKKLLELKTRVNGSALTSDMQEITKAFFDSLDKLLQQNDQPTERKKSGRRTLAEESIQLTLELKESQTEALLNIFDAEQKAMLIAYEPIKKYLDTLEKFLSESGKKLWFSDESLQLSFYISSAGEKAEGPGRNLKDLSSGERQILIVLTYLAFLSGPNSIFIIDEPELSLHLRWQGYLIDALKNLRPSGSQILIATHAPEIAGRARRHSIQLTQKYLPIIGTQSDV